MQHGPSHLKIRADGEYAWVPQLDSYRRHQQDDLFSTLITIHRAHSNVPLEHGTNLDIENGCLADMTSMILAVSTDAFVVVTARLTSSASGLDLGWNKQILPRGSRPAIRQLCRVFSGTGGSGIEDGAGSRGVSLHISLAGTASGGRPAYLPVDTGLVITGRDAPIFCSAVRRS